MLVGRTGYLQLPVRGQLDVLLVVRVVHLAQLAEVSRRVELGGVLPARTRGLDNRFFLGILNLLLEFEAFKAEVFPAELLIGRGDT